MGGDAGVILLSILLVLANAFFVAAEYALVGSRSSRLEALGRRGNKSARLVLKALAHLSHYVAGVQVGISMLGILVGAVTEPYITQLLSGVIGGLPKVARTAISIVLVTYVLVVAGELLPKYLTLRHPEKVSVYAIRLLNAFMFLLSPLVWLVQRSGSVIMRPFGIKVEQSERDRVDREELLLMIQAGSSEGALQKTHADLVSRALRLDVLAANDIMVHRLDIKWLNVDLSLEELLAKLKAIPYSRMPVCRGDIDDVVGIVYLHDIVKSLDAQDFKLEKLLRPAVSIPENLTIDRIVATMRDSKTQILLVLDEYGGTSGLITLEDVIEEVFGDLEDRLESERPTIESLPGGRVSARADVRLDELLAKLGIHLEAGDTTATLAEIIIGELGRVPRPGDSVRHEIGTLRVENMARRRITRVSIQLNPERLGDD